MAKLRIDTYLPASPDRIWEEVRRPELLTHVCHPILRFKPLDPAAFPEIWSVGDFRVGLRLFGVIPLGWQMVSIHFPRGAGGEKQVRDKGHGFLIRVWDHLITLTPEGEGTRYVDEVEIRAGLLTPIFWLFAKLFYAHRQRRWRKLVARGFRYD